MKSQVESALTTLCRVEIAKATPSLELPLLQTRESHCH